MRKRLVITVFVLAALSLTTAAQAAKIVNVAVPVSRTVTVPCTGDSVQLSGTLHVVITLTTNKNFIIGKIHTNARDVHGTSSLGVTYRTTGASNTHFKVSLKNGSAKLRTTTHLSARAKGGNKASITLTAVLLISAKGQLLSRSVQLTASC